MSRFIARFLSVPGRPGAASSPASLFLSAFAVSCITLGRAAALIWFLSDRTVSCITLGRSAAGRIPVSILVPILS